jgi:dihydroxyacetone kinase-like predicted kinase
MNIFRQLIETDDMGIFLADATHENSLIQSIKVYPIEDGKVGEVLAYTMEDLPDLLEKMQHNLTTLESNNNP